MNVPQLAKSTALKHEMPHFDQLESDELSSPENTLPSDTPALKFKAGIILGGMLVSPFTVIRTHPPLGSIYLSI
jgi:hypothetical protein